MNKKNVSQVSRIAKLGKFVKIDGSVRIRNDVEIKCKQCPKNQKS